MDAAHLIRPMRLQDVPKVAEIEAATFSTPWSRDAFVRLLKAAGGVEAWVATRSPDELPIGYAILWSVAGEGELANLAVEQASRGLGIGGALLDHAIRAARAAGVRELFLEVRASNSAAARLYETRGFRPAGVRKGYYTRPVEDAQILRLTL